MATVIKVASVVFFYWIVSISAIFLNKSVFSDYHTDATIFLTWLQTISAIIGCYVLKFLASQSAFFSFFPQVEYNYSIGAKIMPLTFLFSMMLIFNNYCLKHVQITFYQVARSLGIPLTVIFAYIINKQHTSLRCLSCCGIIIFGYLLGIKGEIRFSLSGTICGVASSVFSTLYFIYIKNMLPIVNDNSWYLMYYNNMNACILLPIFFCLNKELNSLKDDIWMFPGFYVVIFLSGILGFIVGFATYAQIQVTSSLTHNISGSCKACLQTLMGAYIKKELVSLRGGIGIALTIIGSLFYSFVRYKETKPKPSSDHT